MMKFRKLKVFAVLITIPAVWLFTNTFGPLDTYPRLLQAQGSVDGGWELEVYRRKLVAFSPLSDSEIVFRIRDVRGGRVSEQRIWTTTWWTMFGGWREHSARFESHEIIVDDFWVADKESLGFRMCPLLRCLKESE